MESDPRYQWLEQRITLSLNPKREALLSLSENEDNKLIIMEFLNNEDVKNLFVYSKSQISMAASRSCATPDNAEKGIFFLKVSNASKLTNDKMNQQVTFFESSNRIFDHMDLMTREIFMPLLCSSSSTGAAGQLAAISSPQATSTDLSSSMSEMTTHSSSADKLMDIMHRIISQIALAQSQVGDSVNLPMPSLTLLASAAATPSRRIIVLHILETTLISWQKQIRNAIRQQPEISNVKVNFFTQNEIQLWTSYINKLNNLMVQLDAPHVKDILLNLENNNSAYIQPFYSMKHEIIISIKSAEINLRYISTLTPWIHRIKSSNLAEDAQYLFTGLFHTLLLIWQNSRYYHKKERFAHMLQFLSNEIVAVSKEVVGDQILEDPLRSYSKLKEALKICAMFRGTFLDFKEKADALNTKFFKLDKKIDFNEKPIWWVQPYLNDENKKLAEVDEYEVMRENSPWPKRNHNCFLFLNVFMERCNDILELVQTMRHFQILSKTVLIGGSDNRNMDILAQEIHMKYVRALADFKCNIKDVMNFENKDQNFEISFFNLRTTIKELERELSNILNVSIKNCVTISSKLRLFEVFEGVHERDVIQKQLTKEFNWLINEMLKEFNNVRELCASSTKAADEQKSFMPKIVNRLFWFHGLEKRIRTPMEKFSYLYPNLLLTDLGYKLRESFKTTLDTIENGKNKEIKAWKATIEPNLTEKLLQTVLKNASIEDINVKRPSCLEVNLDFELEKFLKELHYLRKAPFNMDINNLLRDKFSEINDEHKLRLYATRMRSIVDKYNLIMKNIQAEEIPLLELKLNKMDQIIELGLTRYTWNSVEVPDYIENAHSLICADIYRNLETTQSNARDIYSLVSGWCEYDSDIFKNRDLNAKTNSAKELEDKQMALHEAFKKEITKNGNSIHTLIQSTLEAVQISEASPGWQEYINFTNEIIFNGFKISSLNSLNNMYNSMVDEEELKAPFVMIDLELINSKLIFNPPLDESSHMKNLQEILFDFINTFISRGSYMLALGKNRTSYDQMVARDEVVFDMVSKINESIEKTSGECRKIIDYFNAYSFLWQSDIHETFEQFLRGQASISRESKPRPPSKNFMSTNAQVNNRGVARSVASLGSILTPEMITTIERTFLSPYYQSLSKQEKEQGLTPLLEDFDAEIAVYVNAQEKIHTFESFQDINWVRVKLQPTKDVLLTLTNKLIWKFTDFLSTQIKKTLNELDQFLKQMEPDIEKITGEERDTATFMKIMRMFNEVSSKQQEMEIKFELMKRTLNLLKKYKRFDVVDLEAKFNSTPIRWTNLKSKVTLAKQRLGPTIQEESQSIMEDLKDFSSIINNLLSDILKSSLFSHQCDENKALQKLDEFTARWERLQKEAEDLKQLQELLDANVVDFSQLINARHTIHCLKQAWKTIKEIREKHNEWKSIRWQKVNIKNVFEETDNQLESLNGLAAEAHLWDCFMGTQDDINNIRSCLPIIEEIANPAMRTRHWKQLIRLSGGTSMIDNETLKMLTFGQLLDLNLHAHVDEVRMIVQKAVKDLSIEQTIKTYEEIWLSKTFQLELFSYQRSIERGVEHEDDDKSSHDRRSSQSRGGLIAGISTKSTKRISIGSLPQSLIGAEPITDNDPVYLLVNPESLFVELDHHQIVLEELLQNQSAGSFYDEIIKWQKMLQNIEAVLQEWSRVQYKWKRLEPIYALREIQTILAQDSANFYKSDRDFRTLMKATYKNNNILKCCQRKNILHILKHLHSNLDTCYEALIQELAKKRSKCPRLYLLSDEHLLDVLCCGSNLKGLSNQIGLVFNELKSIRTEESGDSMRVVGCYGQNGEYFPLKTAVVFRGSVEELINSLEKEIPESLKYLLQLAIKGSQPPINRSLSSGAAQTLPKKTPSPDFKTQVSQNNRALTPINETAREIGKEKDNAISPAILSWLFQHTSQIVELALRILFTKQIESCLGKLDDLKKLESKLDMMIEFYNKQLTNFNLCEKKTTNTESNGNGKDEPKEDTNNGQTGVVNNEEANKTATTTAKNLSSAVVMSSSEHNKLELVTKILLYYRRLVKDLMQKNVSSPDSNDWKRIPRFYVKSSGNSENDLKVLVQVMGVEINYGFQYCSPLSHENSILLFNSEQLEFNMYYIMSFLKTGSSPLLHGYKCSDVLASLGRELGYEILFFTCSSTTSAESLNNICKAMVLSGGLYWVAFHRLNELSTSLMSSLSNVLTQINERKEKVTIGNEELVLSTSQSDSTAAYFGIVVTGSDNHRDDEDIVRVDSLKITSIEHEFNAISKDLFEKFRVVRIDHVPLEVERRNFLSSSLVTRGFTKNDEISTFLFRVKTFYQDLLTCYYSQSRRLDLFDSMLFKVFINEASDLVVNWNALNNCLPSVANQQINDQIEKDSIATVFTNALFSRVNSSSGKMLLSFITTLWPDAKLPYRYEYLFKNDKETLNLPVWVEKETAMQIEDKNVLNSLSDSVLVATSRLNLAPSILFQIKCMNLLEDLIKIKNLIVVGKSGVGKTTCFNTAVSALCELGYLVNTSHIYIDSYSSSELFGTSSTKSGMIKEGIISHLLRNIDRNSNFNILHIVGESSSQDSLYYESLFENKSIFMNQNNEKTFVETEKLRLVWETDDLSHISPSILATSNMIYIDDPLVSWKHLVEAFFQLYDNAVGESSSSLSSFKAIKKEIISTLEMIKKEIVDSSQATLYTDALPVPFESKVRLVLTILKGMIKNRDRWEERDLNPIAEYCAFSGVSASMSSEGREAFSSWAKAVTNTYPREGAIYDYFYDADLHQYQLWSEIIPSFSCPVYQGIPLNVFVHTPSTMFLSSMIDVMMNLDESMMIVGETGCGKTSLISDKLKTSCSGDLSELFYITINTNRLTNSRYLHSRINNHLVWVHGSHYMPKGNKKMYCFIDDLHLAQINENNRRQTALEFLRQHLDSDGFYDLKSKWQRTKNITYISTFNHKAYAPSSSLSSKILKHFHVIAQHFPNDTETHTIYTKLLYRHLIGDFENEASKISATVTSRLKNLQTVIKNIIQSSIELNKKMRSIFLEKSQRLHYIFTLRVLTSLFRHMCVSLNPENTTKEQLLELWHHECDWLFGHRMIDNVDIERYELAYNTVIKKNFGGGIGGGDVEEGGDVGGNQLRLLLNHDVPFSNLKETESGIVVAGGIGSASSNSSSLNSNSSSNSNEESGVDSAGASSASSSSASKFGAFITDGYEPHANLGEIRRLVQTALNEYNKEQQHIVIPLYDAHLSLVTRLCHSTQCVGGNCCIVADGGLSPFLIQLVASLMQFSLVYFKASQFVHSREQFFAQLKTKLVASYYRAGIRGEKVMLCLTEEEMYHKEFLAYITEFLISEEVMHLFTIEEETTILNSIRTQVVQSGLVYTREIAWEFFMKNIRENTRVVIVINESAKKFQTLSIEYPSLFNNMELIWVQNWNMKQLVDNALYHLNDIKWLDRSTKENLAHLLASMHSSIREQDATNSAHLNNLAYTKFVQRFTDILMKKYKEVEESHKNSCRLLEHIQRQHSIAKKLMVQLQQETLVLEERINSTNKMLQQIGQDMTMTEQQIKVHSSQTKKTVQLKRILPEFQFAHERNVYKTVAIVSNTKKQIQSMNMQSLQELRSTQKPEIAVEDTLAAVIMILKSPTADLTWTKGAKRQMANLDRFLEELQSFDEREMTEQTIKIVQEHVLTRLAPEANNIGELQRQPYYEALRTLQDWIQGVLRYHILMNKHVKPLHNKCLEIEREVKEAEFKLVALNRKTEALNARLKDLSENFEEATVDKKEQEEKVQKMKSQLQTASELNTILSREFERNMQIYDSIQERIFCLPGACALAAGFLVYLGPYQFPFRRTMLTSHWVKCLHDRGLPLVLDSISSIKGRVAKWQMPSLSYLLAFSGDVSVPGDEWRVHFASEQVVNEPFIVPINEIGESSVLASTGREEQPQPPQAINSGEAAAVEQRRQSRISQKPAEPQPPQSQQQPPSQEATEATKLANNVDQQITNSENNVNGKNVESQQPQDELIRIDNHNVALVSQSRISEQIEIDETFVSAAEYRLLMLYLIQYVIGDELSTEWMSNGASSLELENGSIIACSQKHPPLIYDPFYTGTNWIMNKITNLLIDLENRNSENLLTIEKSFQAGTKILYSNCVDIDSTLLPLIYYKNSMTSTSGNEESRLLMFSNRRLFCNPEFQMYFETSLPLEKFSPNTLSCTTPISYHPSVENFIDEFELSIFESLFPAEFEKRKLLLDCVNDCNRKLASIDRFLKDEWENKNGFHHDQIVLTKVALQRKYKIGKIVEYCQDYLSTINELMKVLTPLAIRASLLMTLAHKMSYISKNYEFSINLVEFIFASLPSLAQPMIQKLEINLDFLNESSDEIPQDLSETAKKFVETQIPVVPDIANQKLTSTEINAYSQEDILKMTKYLTNSFLNSILISILPEHRLYLLTLICFYIKSEEKEEFTDLELEFLMRGSKYNTNISVELSDFGVPKTVKPPKWIGSDSWQDVLAMSLLQGDLDHFVVALISAENDWKKWYDDPLRVDIPKIEMEVDKSSKSEYVELNNFRKLIVSKVLRPDAFITRLNAYVNNALELKLAEPSWAFVFENALFKSVIVNMGTKSNISSTSSMSRIHKNLFLIAKANARRVTALNCNFLTLSELRVVVKNVTDGELILLKNVHLASKDLVDYIKMIVCNMISNDDESKMNWRLILTKSFDYVLPLIVTSQSLQVSFDVIDIIAHNSLASNKKLSLDTCQIQPETIIFNSIQSSLNLAKSDEITPLVSKSIPKERLSLVYFVCLVHGILQSRQSLACGGLTKFFPWRISNIIECLHSIIRADNNRSTNLAQIIVDEVYSSYFDDEMDRDYVLRLFKVLFESRGQQITINQVTIPVPGPEIAPSDYPNWFEEKIPDRKIDSRILELHEKHIRYYSTLRAEEFIENLENLWENNTSNVEKLGEDLDQDCLYYAIKLCNDKLPPKLPDVDTSRLEIAAQSAISFAILQEYNLFNENIDLVREHLRNVEKYLLLNTQLFPKEWKSIALSLQLQRVPEPWEHPNCRPSIHTLQSWIKCQNIRYKQLNEFYENNFKEIKAVKAGILKEPNSLLRAVLVESCLRNKWNFEEVELCFEAGVDIEAQKSAKIVDSGEGIVLHDVKIFGGVWDPTKKCVITSENLINRMVPIRVSVRKSDLNRSDEVGNTIFAYMTQLRQTMVSKMKFTSVVMNSGGENKNTPFLILNSIDEEHQSRRMHRPVISAIKTINNALNSSSSAIFSGRVAAEKSAAERSNTTTSNNTKSANNKQAMSSMSTASGRRNADVALPTPESQMSYKAMSPKAPPLPPDLKAAFTRSNA